MAIELRNSAELVLAIVAAWKCGAVPVPMRWDLPDWERSRLLEVVAPALTLTYDDLPELTQDSAGQSTALLDDAMGPQVNGICSGGSTGTPKVILTNRPAVWIPEAATPFADAWGEPVARPQTILVPAPIYHTTGFAPLLMMLGGDRLVLLEKFDAELFIDLVEKHRVSTFTATPTMLQRLARVPGVEKRDLSSIVWILQGAAVIPPALVHRWFDLIGPKKLFQAYGMTEQLGLTALRGDEWLAHPGSVGRGFRGTEVRILDDAGDDLPVGEVGEIYLRSPFTAYSYLGGAALLPSTDDGFATAGDLGHLDADGYLYLADRRVDVIISGGANVYPAEVETALSDHPAIADVVVIGLRDPEWGQRVHAIVEPVDASRPPTDVEVIGYAKQRLSPYKVPKSVEVVDRIPRSAVTKVNRSALVAERES